MYDLMISDGLLVNTTEIIKTNLYIKDGKVAAVTPEVLPAREKRDASNLHILPGCLDIHVHFRDPGATHKEDFIHGTKAAAIGGITTVFEMPNTNPAVLGAEDVITKAAYLSDRAFVDFALWGLCLGKINADRIAGAVAAGAIAFKFFWGYAFDSKSYALVYNYDPSAPGVMPPLDDGEIFELFEDVAKTGTTLAIHAEHAPLIQLLTKRVLSEGRRDYQALLDARPNLSEALTVQTAIAYSRATGLRLHIMHISSSEAVEFVRQAKREGLPVTGETCPGYLFLTSDDFARLGPAMKVYPPIRGQKDQDALWVGLQDGTLSLVCSDHAPQTIEEKMGDLFSIPAGSANVQLTLPLMLDAVSRGKITLPLVVKTFSENPAKLFNLYPLKGSLTEGADADFVLVDMRKTQTITNDMLAIKQKFSVFNGATTTGWPVATYLRGKHVVEGGAIVSPQPNGRFIKPNN